MNQHSTVAGDFCACPQIVDDDDCQFLDHVVVFKTSGDANPIWWSWLLHRDGNCATGFVTISSWGNQFRISKLKLCAQLTHMST